MTTSTDVHHSDERIRFFRFTSRVTAGTALKLKLRETPPEAAFVGVWIEYFMIYDYNHLGGESERNRARKNLDRILEVKCTRPETLFVGELLGGDIFFEGPVDHSRITCLCNLLRGAFGYRPLLAEPLMILGLNPQILMGTYKIGHLQTLVGHVDSGIRNKN